MPDFIYDIRDKLLDALDTVRSYLPADMDEYTPYAIPGVAIILSALALVFSFQSNKLAGNLEAKSRVYSAGQQQIEGTLGDVKLIDLDEEGKENLGKSDLMLQYRKLSLLPEETNINNMEQMANVSSSAEEAAEFDRDQSFFNLIPSFAGSFGGVMVKRSIEGTEPDIRMAAYRDESEMSAPEDSTVMNVLVQHLDRTIPSNMYGVADIHNTLVVLSGTDIRKFSVIGRGSIMYTLFGKSEGSKISRKYVCTGIEPGTIDEINQSGTSSFTVEEPPAEATGTSLEYTDDAMPHTGAEVKSVNEDGSVVYTDNTVVYSNGVVVYEDGTIVDTDGTVYYSDGMIVTPDGKISGGVISNGENGNAESSAEGDKDKEDAENAEGTSENGSSENPENGAVPGYGSSYMGNDGSEFAGEADSVFTRHVYTADGNDILKDKSHDLIFYMMNSQTGTVTITYWNLAGSEAANAVMNDFANSYSY